MSIDRWDPFRDMVAIGEAMDRWLQQSISGTGQRLSSFRPDAIPIDLVERDDAFEVREAVPGVRPAAGDLPRRPRTILSAVTFWLLRTEPTEFSFDDLVSWGVEPWYGARSPAAFSNLRSALPGETAVIYHTGTERQAVGLATVEKT